VADRADALFVATDSLFTGRFVQFVTLAAHHRVPAAYTQRDFAEAAGLMSYGTDILDMFRRVGAYTGQILKGAKPADLPVVQMNKLDLVINMPTARALGFEVSPQRLARADEVIE
jgi:putative tryptophan/tyrosine transport system substrate-binding protein